MSIGTELLLGQIVDTNAQFIASELAKLGINCYFRTTVGDNKERIKEALLNALKRSEIVITTGGLGPTADDLTTECIAELFEVPLYFDEEVFEHIKRLFASFRYTMPESNRKQALRPEGSGILPNPAGTAPGVLWKLPEDLSERIGLIKSKLPRSILTFPGVPRELKAMWQETAMDYLSKTYAVGTFWSRDLKHYGIGESALAEKYAHLLNLENPTVAPYAGNWECRLRVTARAETEEQARLLAAPVIEEIVTNSGSLCYGFDDATLDSVLGELLSQRHLTLAVAESCTGGLVSERLTDRPGSSEYIKLNVVTYSNEAKSKILGVEEKVLIEHGAVSAECAEQMAVGIRNLAQTDLGMSVTGIAGPGGGTEEKPVGLTYVGLSWQGGYEGKKINLPSRHARKDMRLRASNEALNLMRLHLLNQK
jgi:nicotinamide-nucleotide amidase